MRSTPSLPPRLRQSLARALAAGGLAIGLLWTETAAPQTPRKLSAEQLKAIYLFGFVRFTEWPRDPDDNEAPYTIGLWGEAAFAKELGLLVASKNVNGRSVQVRNLKSAADAATCHLVYIAHQDAERRRALARAVAAKPVLLVADGAEAIHQGAAIGLVLRQARLRYRVNLAAAKARGLKLNSEFLRSAEQVVK